ncbi:MAG: amidohydrolase [Leucobacter sp.]
MNATHADLLMFNAVMWSEGRVLPHTALVSRGGRIVALGGAELSTQYTVDRTVDADGCLVTPGFIDAHVHAAYGGVEMNRCDLTEAADAAATLETIADYAAANPEEPWILGGGWGMAYFPGGAPTKTQLDAVVPDRPAYLINNDHHSAWVNSRALELAGITRDTPDPADGRIERDEHGDPSGTLHEGAVELLATVLPETTLGELRDGILTAQKRLFGYGIVGWQEAILGEYAGYPDVTPVYSSMVQSGELRARASGALWVARDFGGMSIPDYVDELLRRRAKYELDGLVLDTAKIMVDGTPESETAAMIDPYVGRVPDSGSGSCSCERGNGLSYFSREQLLELVPLLNSRGLNAHIHAIGDRAVRYALDAIEAVPEAVRRERRNHIAHIQVVNPADIPRFAQLGATVNAQMLWAHLDDQMVDLTLPVLGETRAALQYPFASIKRSGSEFAAGSDWPVSTPDPWQAIHVAVNRQSDEGRPEQLIADEALTIDEALAAYTQGSSRVLGLPGGSISVGAVCDLAVADRNPFAAEMTELSGTTNRMTVLGGTVVFETEDA